MAVVSQNCLKGIERKSNFILCKSQHTFACLLCHTKVIILRQSKDNFKKKKKF